MVDRTIAKFSVENRQAEIACVNPLDDAEPQHLHGLFHRRTKLQRRLDVTARAQREHDKRRDSTFRDDT